MFNTLSIIGYEYDQVKTHAQPDEAHFDRQLKEERIYPHLHLIFNLSNNTFTIHVDTRRHRVYYRTPEVSIELERLHELFAQEAQSQNQPQAQFLTRLSKQALDLAMFNTTRWLNKSDAHNRYQFNQLLKEHRRKKVRKDARRKHLKMKHQNGDASKTWHVSSRETLDPELHEPGQSTT